MFPARCFTQPRQQQVVQCEPSSALDRESCRGSQQAQGEFVTAVGDEQAVTDMGWDPILPMSFAPDQFLRQGLYVFSLALLVYLFPLIKIYRLNILEAARK